MKKISLDVVFIVCTSIFLLFFRLGATTLTNWDEAWFASVAQDMMSRADWLNGHWNGSVWFYEPPLLTWILSFVITLNTSSFSLRLFNALCGLATVLCTYFFTKELTKNHLAALLSSLILLSNIEFLFRSRQINTDIPLTFFLLFSLYALNKSISSKRPFWLLVSVLFLAFAVLTKRASPLLILPSFSVMLFYFRKQVLMVKKWWIAPLVFLFVASPWYLVNIARWGSVFVDQYILSFTLERISMVNPATGTSLFFYAEALKHAFKFWTPIVAGGFLWFIFKSKNNKKFLAIAVVIITFFVAMTVSAKKASWYILPIHPFLAIAGSIFLSQVFLTVKNRLPLFLISIIALGIFTFQLYNWRADYIVPDTTSHQATLAQRAKELTKPNDTIYLDDDYLPVAVFYSQRNVIPLRFNRLGEPNESKLEIPSDSFVLTNTETIELLKSRLIHNTMPVYQIRDLLLLKTL